jgi:DNA repair exonuclease SbcCD ATPase subunit
LQKNGDDNIEQMQHQENAIHAQISQRKSKIIENFDKEEKALYEDLTTGKKKVQERVQEQEIKVESKRTEILKYNQELDFVERHASNIQGYLQLRNVKEKLHQQSNGLHTVLPKITNVSVKYDSKPNVNANSLGDVQLDVPLFITQWMGFRLRRNLLSTKKVNM